MICVCLCAFISLIHSFIHSFIYFLKVLRDLAIFHASFVGRTDELLDYEPMAEVLKCAVNRKSRAKAYLLEALAEAETSFPELVTSKRKRMMENYVTHVDDVTKELKQQPMTLVHYDAHAGECVIKKMMIWVMMM